MTIKNTIYKIAATTLSLLFFHFFPALAATAYMSWHGFYSYDLLSSGGGGVTTFYWWAEAILLVASYYLTGSIYFLTRRILNKESFGKQEWVLLSLSFAINILFLALIFFPDWKRVDGFNKYTLIGTYVIVAWAMVHIGVLFHSKGKQALISIAIGIFILTSISVLSPGALAFPYSLALQYFGVGGGIWAKIKLADREVTGRLIISSPENYYLQIGSALTTIKREDVESIETKNMSGFGHNNKL